MSTISTEAVKELIDIKIAEKAQATMTKEAPANVADKSTWERAKKEAKEQYGEPGGKLPEDRFYATVSHIYQNMGGTYKKKKNKKESMKRLKKKSSKKTNNKHTCPECGKSMTKQDANYRTKPGWSKYKCECGYSRDFRDGAPIYQAIRLGSSWAVFESAIPLFAVHADHVPQEKRAEFLSPDHANRMIAELAHQGAYESVRKWFPDGEGVTLFHPAMKVAAMGVEEPTYRAMVRDILLKKQYKKSAAKTVLASSIYAELRQSLTHPAEWVLNKVMPTGEISKEQYENERFDTKYDKFTVPGMLQTAWQVVSNAGQYASDMVAWAKDFLAAVERGENPTQNVPVTAAAYLGPGYYVKAQGGPAPTDVSVAESQIDTGAEAQGAVPGPQPALVEPEISDELTGETKDTSNLVEAVADVLATIVGNTDALMPEDALTDIREVFTDDDRFSEFKGKLQEKVERQDADEATAEGIEEQPPALQSAPGDMAAPPPQMAAAAQKRQVTAQEWEKYARQVWASRETYRQENEQLREQMQDQNKLVSALNEQQEVNRRLLIERSARIRAPRAVKLAQLMYDIGELGQPGEDQTQDDLVRAVLPSLMTLTEQDFLQKEETTSRIYARLANGSKRALASDESTGGSLLAFVPVTGQKEERDFLGRGSSNNSEYYPWSRGGVLRRV